MLCHADDISSTAVGEWRGCLADAVWRPAKKRGAEMCAFLRRPLRFLALLAVATGFALVPSALGGHAVGGTDVKVTNDNNNVDGGTPNPGFDAQNRQSNETTVSISPANPSIVAAGGNDYRMVTVTADVWFGVYVSSNAGATWFNTMVPGFPSDTSPAGLASPGPRCVG
jgi:hypothetical protein